MMKKITFFWSLVLLTSLTLSAKEIFIEPSDNSQEEVQTALIELSSGDILTLSPGTFVFEDGLSLDVDEVIVRGSGINETILDFKNQMSGAQGLLVTSDRVTLKDFAVTDAKGDAIKVIGAEGINMINLKTEWTGGPKTTNGAYGLYPVESTDVLIDGCVAIGASDAGIYVGQSKNIIVRNSVAQYNVAGIEIENSYYADVYDNLASHNTGGILVFDLPDLPQQGGRHVRVFRNQVIDNDTDNFAPEGNIVGEVPRGTGIIIQANSDVEVFDNDISGNGTVNVSIVTYSNETQDENYYPHPRSIQIHGNRFGEGGFDPDIETGELAAILFELSGGNMPDIFWDGVLPTSQIIFGQPDEERLILSNNGDATFLTINPIKYLLPFFDPVETDISEYEGEVRPLAEITINSF
jgi:parallel beta-helix repeat protein|tara:strand:- start:1399 stop:2625 length:1227 start_codon:yes stop_codon:yes gene_type:complete